MDVETIPRYEIEIFWSDEDEAYIATVPDLPYCSAWGGTYEEALTQVQDAIRGHIEVRLETGRPVPEPRSHDEIEAYERPAEQINAAAQVFARAVQGSLRVVEPTIVQPQVISREITRNFFDAVNVALRDQIQGSARAYIEMGQVVSMQALEQREDFQQLSEESINAYAEFMRSMLAYYQTNMERSEQNPQ